MSSTTPTPETVVTETTEPTMASRKWLSAIGAGLLGGIAMGVIVAVMMPGALDVAIPALYGMSGFLVGVTAHLVHAAILGVVFAAIVSIGALRKYGERVTTSTALGLGYGVVLWVVTGSILLPAWLNAVGFAGAPAVPTFTAESFITHAVYGLVLGAAYPYLKNLR